jgi:hypothetical protein
MRNRLLSRLLPIAASVAVSAAVAAGTGASPAGRPGSAPPPPERELLVPFDDLHLLLEKSPRRVLIPRDEFLRLLERSERETEATPPESLLPVSGEYRITVGQDRARIQGTLLVDVLREGLHALPLGIGSVSLLDATLDGKPAPMGRDGDKRVTLFVEGTGRHTLELRAVAAVDTTAARQILRFHLPSPATAQLHLTIPGDVEVRGGASVISRIFDAAAAETRCELLANRGPVTLTLSLNSRLKRRERVVVARSVLVDEITQSVERLHAAVSLDILHRPVDDVRFKLPPDFEVHDVSSPQLARWAISEEDGGRVLTVALRRETTGRVLLNITAVRAAYTPGRPWTWPALTPLDVASHAAVVGILLEERLKPVAVSAEGLIAVDGAVLTAALPPSLFRSEPGAARTRPVLTYYAPRTPFGLSARFTKAPAQLDVTTNLLLTFGDAGLKLQGGFAMIPRAGPLFSFDFTAPPGWDVVSVTDTQQHDLVFERYPAAEAGTRVHVRLREGVTPLRESRVHVTARQIPPDWLGAWKEQAVPLPVFAVTGADRDIGAVAIGVNDDMRVQPTQLEGLTPLDANEKKLYGLTDTGTDLAYRYDSRPYGAELRVTRIPARLTAETYSFFRLGRDALHVHYELIYAVEQAKVREVALTLPSRTPTALSIHGLRGTTVKETAPEEGPERRRWTALLSEARAENVHLAVDFQLPLAALSGTNAALPLVRAEGVAYQSGLVAIEGNPELDVQVTEHPRKVDIGELAEAEYLPGRRLLGVYGFVGDPPPVRISTSERPGYPLPPAIVQRTELETALAAEGLSQTSARFHLSSRAVYVDIRLPEHSTLWSVILDGAPVKPQRQGDSVLLDLRADDATSRELTVVYETPVAPLALWRQVTVPAPRLRLHDRKGDAGRDVPVTDMTWSLYPPNGYRVLAAGGSVATRSIRPTRPAAASLAERLCRLAGGIGFRRGLIAGCAAPFTMARSKARLAHKMSTDEYVEFDAEGATVQRAASTTAAPAPPEKPRSHKRKPTGSEFQRDRMIEKMRSIKIPEIDFRQVNIYDAIIFLADASVENDRDAAPGEKKGVDIILDLGAAGRPPAPMSDDPFADALDLGGQDSSIRADIPLITFRARYISLHEALRIITSVAGLKYTIRGSVVIVVPRHAPDADLVTRTYHAGPPLKKFIREVASSLADRGPNRWKQLFTDMGVSWPEGSTVSVMPPIGRIIAKNTPDNLSRLEDILDTIEAGPEAHVAETEETQDGMRREHEYESQRTRMIEKMKSIKIPEIDFRQANIYDVIDFLSEASIENDSAAEAGEKKGVDIILNLGTGRPTAPVSDDPFADPFADVLGVGGPAPASEIPLITFHARYVTLLEALRIVTSVAGLKYTIRDSVVMVVPLDAPDSDIVVRMYDAVPGIEERIGCIAAELGTAQQESESGDFISIGSSDLSRERSDWKQFFETMGVAWPEGSSVRYVPGINKLIVANTGNNLVTFDQTLSALDVRPGAASTGGRSRLPWSASFSGPAQKSLPTKWVVDGSRSLKIALTKGGNALAFTSLGVDPELSLTVVNARRVDALAAMLALTTFLLGCLLTASRPGTKAAYIAGVLMLATALPAMPLLPDLATLLNGCFYAACLLIPYYLIAGLVRRVRHGRRTWAASVVRLLACVGLTLSTASARAAKDESHPPLDVPPDAVVVPYADSLPFDSEHILLPYDRYTNLWHKAYPTAVTNPPPAAFGLGAATYDGRLENDDTLTLTGRMTVDVYADGLVAIPFPIEGGVLTSATLDRATARIGMRPAPAPTPNQQPEQQRQQQPQRYAGPSAGAGNTLYVTGRGSHTLTFTCSMSVTRNGGRRSVRGRLPAPPATALRLVVPEPRTEVVVQQVADRRLYRTQAANETVEVPVGTGGRLSIQWRPRISEGEVDLTLTAESRGVLDLREDYLTLAWELDFRFRRGERSVLNMRLPDGYLIGEVTGANVRGWDTPEEDPQRLTVTLLKQAKERERIRLKLWQPARLAGTNSVAIDVPFVSVPDAGRHTGRFLIRRSRMLDVRTTAVRDATRAELGDSSVQKLLSTVAADSPLGIRAYQAYTFIALPCSIGLTVTPTPAKVTAHTQSLLRIAERERTLESRVMLEVGQRPLHAVAIRIPDDLTLDDVTAPGIFEWVEERPAGQRQVTVRFHAGLRGRIPIVIRGRVGAVGLVRNIALPVVAAMGVDEQTGDIVVQADPAFDVHADGLRGIETVLLKRVYGWLEEKQRSLACLALRYEATDYGGSLRLVPRKPDVSCYTVTNIRVTDRAIEETVLLNYTIHNAGVRELRFEIPGHLADAKFHVPLLRQKEISTAGTGRWQRVRLELQDDVMNEVKVLVEHDRLLSKSEHLVQFPVVRTGRVVRQYLAYESAGRDEVIVDELTALEPIGRRQKEWATVASLLRGGTTQAFVARRDKGTPLLRFHTRQRKAVTTAGARIGFARTVLALDANGAYRAQQVYQVDNRTEQYLAVSLPAGAALWSARVADEYVKPVMPGDGDASLVRIPLVKTAAGDLDYTVTLTYGGKLPRLRSLKRLEFPLARTGNIHVELSQVELRLPVEFHWMHFGGTMREETQAGAFEASYVGYQNKLAKRLVQTLKFGNVFEQTRAVNNLRLLEDAIDDYRQNFGAIAVGNEKLNLEISNASAIFEAADRQIDAAAQVDEDMADNRGRMNDAFEGQYNKLARNVVLNTAPNWDVPGPGEEARTQTLFNGTWLANGMLTNAATMPSTANNLLLAQFGTHFAEVDQAPPRQAVYFGKGQAQGKLFRSIQAKKPAAPLGGVARQPNQPQSGFKKSKGGRRSQKALAQKYQQRLQEQAAQQPMLQDDAFAADPFADAAPFSAAADEPEPTDVAGRLIVRTEAAAPLAGETVPAAGAVAVASGLRSLDVELPEADTSRWTVRRFTTPRGDVTLNALALSELAIDGFKRLGTALAGFALVLIGTLVSRRGLGLRGWRRTGAGMTLVCAIALLVGVLPIAAALGAIAGIAIRIGTGRRLRRMEGTLDG